MYKELSIVILAGGKGTRVKSVLGDIPKILAPIKNKVFLDFLLAWIDKNFKNFCYEIIIASGFGHDKLQKYCFDKNLQLELSPEDEPLGTLGAAANAAILSKSKNILILNGDTIFECNFQKVFQEFLNSSKALTIVLDKKENDRYGGYNVNKDGFLELSKFNSSYISMGATFTKKELLITTYKNFSSTKGKFAMMDEEFISKVSTKPFILKENNPFIDIGTLNSYEESQEIVPLLIT